MYRPPDGTPAVPSMEWPPALQGASPYVLLPPQWAGGAPYHLQPSLLATNPAAAWTSALLQSSVASQAGTAPPLHTQQQEAIAGQQQQQQQPFAVVPGASAAQAGTAAPNVSQTAAALNASSKWGGKVELAQRWLLFMRHCATCKAPNGQCEHGSRCRSGRSLWDHMINCQAAGDCRYPKCHQVKAILKHHKKCTSVTCRVCMPVKRYVNRTAPVNPLPASAGAKATPVASHQPGALTARLDGAHINPSLKQ